MTKPYASSCDENRAPILDVIKPLLQSRKSVLEIGSGTGQHAVYFSKSMPHLVWHTSDCITNHAGIRQWVDESGLDNVTLPLELDVTQQDWPELKVDAVFSANTLHIMSWHHVEAFFNNMSQVLIKGGILLVYGPFNYHGKYTSDSNERFDHWLKERDPKSGIRDFDEINQLAEQNGLKLEQDYEMPVNNRILYWKRVQD